MGLGMGEAEQEPPTPRWTWPCHFDPSHSRCLAGVQLPGKGVGAGLNGAAGEET